MNLIDTLPVVNTLHTWAQGGPELGELARLLATDYQTIFNLFWNAQLCKMSGEARDDYEPHVLFEACMLLIAMRPPTRIRQPKRGR